MPSGLTLVIAMHLVIASFVTLYANMTTCTMGDVFRRNMPRNSGAAVRCRAAANPV